MAEAMQPKLPLPRLLVTARPQKKAKQRKPVEEKAATKKALDKARAQTRVNIGAAFERWRQLKDLGLKSDVEVALFLLDSGGQHYAERLQPAETTEEDDDEEREEEEWEEEEDNNNSAASRNMAENLGEVVPPKKKKACRTAEGLLAKKECDKRRKQTRICLGVAFPRWRALKEEIGLRADTDVALVLLDNYEKGPIASTDIMTDSNIRPPPPPSRSSNGTKSKSRSATCFRNAACQTDSLRLSTRCTQLSVGTLCQHPLESKGTQTPACSVGDGPTDGDKPKGTVTSAPATPSSAKRPRLEFKVEDESEASTFLQDPHDTTSHPAEPMSHGTQSSHTLATSTCGYTDRKYIVTEKCLLEIFESCPVCKRESEAAPCRRGTFLSVYQKCRHCGFYREWKSQPVIGSCPIVDLQLSAALYFTGGSFCQLQKVFKAMNLQSINHTTFRMHAQTYLEPAVIHKWHQFQQSELPHLRETKVKLGGDMTADSPGRSAKYGSYSLMNLENNNIIDLQLVQSNEVGGSHNMEKEGLKRSLEFLELEGVEVDYVVTDRHDQIETFLRESKIQHFYDVRQLQQALSKKVDKLSKEKDGEIEKRWRRGISDHVDWTAASSSTGTEEEVKWSEPLDHVPNQHKRRHSALPIALHPFRRTRATKKWLKPGTKDLFKTEKILSNKRVRAENNVVSFIGMLCRQYLAAMRFNENAGHTQARTTSGRLSLKSPFPKEKTAEATVKPVETEPTYCYISSLMALLFDKVVPSPRPYLEELHTIPVPGGLTPEYEYEYE